MKKALYTILTIVFSLIILVNIFSSLNLSFLGFRVYKIGSGSMQPYLNINDIIIVKEKNMYQLNDVITYKNDDNEYITHRVIRINNNEIVTKGDANNTEDKPITKDDVIGKVIFKIMGFGFILFLFSNPTSWVLLFIIGIIITIFIPDKKKI